MAVPADRREVLREVRPADHPVVPRAVATSATAHQAVPRAAAPAAVRADRPAVHGAVVITTVDPAVVLADRAVGNPRCVALR